MKARNMTEEQVKRDVLLAAQPTKEFVTVEQVAALALYLTLGRRRRRSPAPTCRSTAAGPRSERSRTRAIRWTRDGRGAA